jgi:hypothetical protein
MNTLEEKVKEKKAKLHELLESVGHCVERPAGNLAGEGADEEGVQRIVMQDWINYLPDPPWNKWENKWDMSFNNST